MKIPSQLLLGLKSLVLLLALTLVGAITAASSQAAGRVYLAAHAGLSQAAHADWTDKQTSGTFDYDPGSVFLLVFGTRVGSVRPELELGLRSHDIDEFTVQGSGKQPLKADQTVASALVNLFVDLPSMGRVTPFVGAGVGMAGIEGNFSNEWGQEADDDSVFAWQGAAGVGISLTQNISLDLGYRYFQTGEAKLERPETLLTAINGSSLRGPSLEFHSQDVLVGVRVLF